MVSASLLYLHSPEAIVLILDADCRITNGEKGHGSTPEVAVETSHHKYFS